MIPFLAAVALTGATVYTGEGPPLEQATVLIQGNRIAAVGRELELPENTEIIDVSGSVITPGLIDGATRLGVNDIWLLEQAVEATAGEKADPVRAALRVEDSFNPESLAIPLARAGGLTSAVVLPEGGLVSGRAIWVDLVERDAVRKTSVALLVRAKRLGEERGGRARAFLRLREIFEDAHLFRANRGPYISRKLRDLSLSAEDLEVLARTLDRELLVLFEVDRAAEIRTVIAFIREHKLRAALLGVAEGWLVAEEIAAAGLSVLVDPLEDLPSDFDALHARSENALLLQRAGVRVAFTRRGDAQFEHRLRWTAGNAVARGFPYPAALAAVTSVPAAIFGMSDAGRIEPGALANLVVWNGDPFEVDTWATRLFIRGREIPLHSRQDALTERYSRP